VSGKTVYWNQADVAPLVLLTGNESYLASRAISGIKAKLRSQHPDLEVTEVAEGEYSAGLLFTVAAPSLFAEPRLVIINTASEGLLEDLNQLIAEPVENCTVVIRIPNAVGHNGKVKTALGPKALTVACEELKKEAEKLSLIHI
jgi:DNA polymerase-3 subunit delta